ncbi:MAG: 5-(carboxyamino)imidazole ribonucleotide mutase [Parcubacteria group bacterium]
MNEKNGSPIKVGIVMGSDSDITEMSKARDVLDEFNVPYAGTICSAHRTPEDVPKLIDAWEGRGCKVFIAGAGWAAHLAGAFAANTILPVIGVPLSSSKLNGLDALLATVQMPSGIPVATIAIDCAANAAFLAMEILAVGGDLDLRDKLLQHRLEMADGVREKSRKLNVHQEWPD